MITGTTKTEELYRAVMLDSSSSLKDFSMDRKKYLRKYIHFEFYCLIKLQMIEFLNVIKSFT